jgi:flagellar biosynthesis protein FlhA
LDASIEQAVESAVQHAEQNSHLSMAPQTIREILDRIQRKVGSPEGPVAAVTTAGARYFLRQMVEPTLPNLFFLSHNEIPAGVKVVSLGVVQ